MGCLTKIGFMAIWIFGFVHCVITDEESNRLQSARKFLDYVERINTDTCDAGTEESITIHFETSIWDSYANVAVKSANLVSKLLLQHGNSLNSTAHMHTLYSIVRNNVLEEVLIFGSAVAFEPKTFMDYNIFCPYASKQENIVEVIDLALHYDYHSNKTQWYHTLRERKWTNVTISKSDIKYRANVSSAGPVITIAEPSATLKDGYWTNPYFDCGAGNIWMTTYSSPILSQIRDKNSTTSVFMGVATIDIELKKIDINQCDTSTFANETGRTVDVFRDTHLCRPSSTCVPIKGKGFVRGSYKCVCAAGYYFQDTEAKKENKYFNGSDIENMISLGNYTSYDLRRFECLRCKEGCETCVDYSSCLYENYLAIRIPILIVVVLMVMGIILTTYFTWSRRDARVREIYIFLKLFVKQARIIIKAASPIFLYIMAAGAFLMCCTGFLEFSQPTGLICMIKPWSTNIGFYLAYGALLLKTWRISAIIKVQTAKRVQLSDKELLKRLVPILGIAVIYLIVWTTAVPVGDRLQTKKTNRGLKYSVCVSGWWVYGSQIGSILLLLWGAYLCFLIRKAPSYLNESKYITWCIYNTVLLGTFILIIEELVAGSLGPDMLYGMLLIRLQIQVTSMMCLIFLPKVYAILSGVNDDDLRGAGTMISTSRPLPTVSDSVRRRQCGTQTDMSLIVLHSNSNKQIPTVNPMLKLSSKCRVHPE